MSDSKLKQYAGMINIAEEASLSEEQLLKIGSRVMFGFNEDLSSCSEWLSDVKKIEDLASLQAKNKTTPLPTSANIKYPLITKACYEFSSRTYPEIVRDGKIVKARTLGRDFTGEKELQAARVSDYINYQLLYESQDWELELDRLLNLLPLIGFICKKTYYDPVKQEIKSELCDYKDLIINSEIKNLNDARRVSHVLKVRLNDLIEKSRAGVFCEEPVEKQIELHQSDEIDPIIEIIEQHTFLDLDEDNYAEPYIVTIIKDTNDVLRIAPRFEAEGIKYKNDKVAYIKAIQLFTDYHFLVNPKGKFQSVGFGILMLHMNETINSLLNILVDAGQLANMRGGYMDSRVQTLGSGNTLHDPGEWKKVKAMGGIMLKDGFLPIEYREPSGVLQQLTQNLIDAGKDLSASSEVMTGSSSADNAKTGAVMALQEQGIKIYTSIHKRIYRSLGNEYKKVYDLDRIYLNPKKYYTMLDDEKAIFQKDFDDATVDILPIADPNLSSEYQRNMKSQLLMVLSQLPGINPVKCSERILMGITNIDHPEELLMSEEEMNKPDPANVKIQADIEKSAQDVNAKNRELDIKEKEVMIEYYKTQCECLKLKADSMLSLAKAESEQASVTFQDYQMQLDMLMTRINSVSDAANFMQQNKQHEDSMGMKQQQMIQDQQQAQQPEEVPPDAQQPNPMA